MRYALALLVLLAFHFVPGVGVGAAQAACNGTVCDTKAEAYQQSYAVMMAVVPTACAGSPAIDYGVGYTNNNNPTQFIGRYMCSTTWRNVGGSQTTWLAECVAGETWDEETKTCKAAFDPQQCLAKPPLGFTKVTASGSWSGVCSDGCQYTQGGALDVQIQNLDGTVVGYTTGWKPSGQACAAGDPVPQPVTESQDCAPSADGQTFCMKPNGQQCYSASTGRQVCWNPGETGEKADGNVLQVRNAGQTPTPPATPPPPGDSFQQQGEPVTKSATVNGQTITTTATNYTTVNGTNAGGSDAGEPGDGSGSSSGDGQGDDPTGAGGTAGGFAEGELYGKSDKTVGSVYAAYKARVEGSPLVGAATGFFAGCSTAGTCPTATWSADDFGIVQDLSDLCTGPLAPLLASAGWVVLALAAFAGFRIAFL